MPRKVFCCPECRGSLDYLEHFVSKTYPYFCASCHLFFRQADVSLESTNTNIINKKNEETTHASKPFESRTLRFV